MNPVPSTSASECQAFQKPRTRCSSCSPLSGMVHGRTASTLHLTTSASVVECPELRRPQPQATTISKTQDRQTRQRCDVYEGRKDLPRTMIEHTLSHRQDTPDPCGQVDRSRSFRRMIVALRTDRPVGLAVTVARACSTLCATTVGPNR